MEARIENFKSIGYMEMRLAPLTILVGPPGGGKSNILEAMALAGYFARFSSRAYTAPCLDFEKHMLQLDTIFTYGTPKRVATELDAGSRGKTTVEIERDDEELTLNVNGVKIRLGPWADLVSMLRNLTLPVEARLYGYDRYGLSSPACSPTACGFVARMKNKYVLPCPRVILSELGWNIAAISEAAREVASELNPLLKELVGIEVKVLQSGAVSVFDHDYEVDPFSVPDSIFRTLYYLLAIKTSVDYAKLYGMEQGYVLLLEGLKVPLQLYPLLVDYLSRAVKHIHVVVEVHEPLLVSALWDEVKDVKTYYVARGGDGLTQAWEVDVEKLAKEGLTAEDLFYMKPREVVGKFTT